MQSMPASERSSIRRTAVAAVFVVVALGLIVAGTTAFTVFASVVGVIAFLELRRILGGPGSRLSLIFGVVAVVVILGLVGTDHIQAVLIVLAALVLMLLAGRVLLLELGQRGVSGATADIAATSTAAAMISVGLVPMAWMRESDHGLQLVLGFAIVFVLQEVLAAAGTRLFGRHRIADRISRRSWEGVFAGAVGAVAGGLLISGFFDPPFNLTSGLGVAAIVAVAAPVAHLMTAALKSGAGMDEADGWISDGGEVLNIIDGVILSAPVVFGLMLRWS